MPVAYAVKPYPLSDEQFKAWIKKLRHLGFQIQNGRWSKKYESAQELRELITHVDLEIEEADINIASPESPPQRLLAYWKQALDLANLDDLFVSPEKKSAAVLQDIPLGRIIGGNLPGRVEYIGEDTQRRGQFEAFMDGATDALKGLPKGADLAENGTSRGVPILILLGAMKRDPKNRSQFKGRVDLAVAGWYLPTSGELTPLPSIGMLVNAKNLAPQDNPRQPLLGDADQLSTVLAEMHEALAKASSENPLAWQEYWQHIDQAFQALQRKSGLKPTSVSTFNYLPYKNSRAREHLACIGIVPAQVTNAANRQLVRLYDSLTEHNAPPALLSRLMQGESGHHAPLADWVGLRQDADAARRMHRGHMGAAFGLDATQRQAVWQAMSSRDGDWVAVSGPPGTGKTSMLQGFIASIAVEAALNQGPSPLVIASSANNQAVKNIIKAFATIAATRADDDPPALEHRWIRNLPSYGWYAPAQSAESKEENAGFQQLCRNRQGFNAFTTNGIAADFEWPITVPPDEVEALRRHFLETFEVACQTVPVLRAQAKCVSVDQVRDRLATLLANLVGDSPSSALSICLRAADELGSVPALAPYDKLCWATRRSSRLDDQRKHRETRRRFKTMRDDRRMLAEQRDALCAAIERIEAPPSSWWRRTLKTVRVILGAPDAARVAQQHLATLLARFSVSPVPDPDDWAALVRAAEVFRRELEKRENVLAQTIATRTNRIERADQLYRAWTNDSAPLIDGLKITYRVRRLLDDTARLGRSDKDAKSWTSGFGAGLQGEDAPALPGIQRDAWTIATRLRHGSLQQQDIIDDILEPCERLIDTTIRRVAFHLAMRYWEARWLIDCDSVIDGEDASAVERSLRRAAMLAPVIVATAQSMPALMGISGNSEAPPSFGWSMADWLIIDEAGQLTPQLGAPISALAKRALVVGDVEQLKPISGLDIATDRALLRVFGLNMQGPMLEQRGLAAAQGSMMAAAERAACRHRNVEEKRWGATLKFHYRCRRTIIEFCNELVYNQMDPLVPMIPDLPPETRLLPPMSFVSVPGQQTPLDGSSWNALELDHLVGWLQEQRLTIEQHYASKNGTGNFPLDLADLVAIVTPYKAQRDQIEEAIKSRLDPLYPTSGGRQSLSKRMTIGTVHALQGAECPIVLFSAVSTLDSGKRPFVDSKADMLNVAVSRAKDAFVLFGHPEVFLDKKSTDRAHSSVLGHYMKERGERLYPRNLIIVESPGKTAAISSLLGRMYVTHATVGHLRALPQGLPPQALLGATPPPWLRQEAKTIALVQHVRDFVAYGERHIDGIFLATDDDVEGEAIAWHVLEVLREDRVALPQDKLRRARFYAVTPMELRRAIADAGYGLDSGRIKAALARAVFDYLIGQQYSAALQGPFGRVVGGMIDILTRADQSRRAAPRWFVRTRWNHAGRSICAWHARRDDDGRLHTQTYVDQHAAERAAQGMGTLQPAVFLRQTLRKRGPDWPATTTDQILSAQMRWLKMSPAEAMNALRALYEGRLPDAADSRGADEQ